MCDNCHKCIQCVSSALTLAACADCPQLSPFWRAVRCGRGEGDKTLIAIAVCKLKCLLFSVFAARIKLNEHNQKHTHDYYTYLFIFYFVDLVFFERIVLRSIRRVSALARVHFLPRHPTADNNSFCRCARIFFYVFLCTNERISLCQPATAAAVITMCPIVWGLSRSRIANIYIQYIRNKMPTLSTDNNSFFYNIHFR